MAFDSTELGYDLIRDICFVLYCPVCGQIMYPIPGGGFECDECGLIEWKTMWILKTKGIRTVVGLNSGNRGNY